MAPKWTRGLQRTRLTVMALALTFGAPVAAQDGEVSGQLEVTSATSAKEKLDFARDALAEMDSTKKRAEKLLDQAERGGEGDQIQCVRLKLASIKTLKQVSERAQSNMSEAIASENDLLADHEFRKIAVALSKVRQFIAEAEACMGEVGSADGSTEVSVNKEGISDAEETEPLTGEIGTVATDPGDISPFE